MSIVGRMRMKLLITISILAAALQIAPVALSQGRQRGGGGERGMAGMGNLTQEERQKVMNARKTAMQDPAVQSARQKMQAASKEMHDAMDAAMLKADPSIKPILDKIPKGQRHMRGGGEEQ
jgi:Spy/CpxP family protein refolding chaperone